MLSRLQIKPAGNNVQKMDKVEDPLQMASSSRDESAGGGVQYKGADLLVMMT